MFSLSRPPSNNYIKVGAYYYAMVELKMVSFIFTEMVVTITMMMMMMMMMIFSLAYAISSSSLSTDEGKALRSTGWWNNSASHHCTWEYVNCNEANSVIEIYISNSDKELGELRKLNFSSFPNLVDLKLYNCGLNGSIPQQIGTLTHLTWLHLGFNNLTGELPLSLANLSQLESLNLSNNRLHGSIPPEFGKMTYLIILHLGYNNLTGVIPSSLGNLTNLTYLSLQSNHISGFIPPEIGNLKKLSTLDMSKNLLSGKIPFQLGNLKEVRYFNLSYNKLSGTVPHSISHSILYNFIWTSIDLSHNQFENQSRALPESLDYNKGSCDVIKGLSRCKKRHQIMLIIIIVSLFATLLLLAAILGFLFHKRRINKNQLVETKKVKNADLFSIWDYDGVIAYHDIIQATENFDIRYCIGTGGYGSVYRARLPSGKVVALKKLHGWESENPAYMKSFENEVQMLSTIQHRNIVKLHGFCLHNKCMFLVYKYMERGSLFCMLRDDIEAVELDWVKRVNVVKGIANALSYMHHDCGLPIIHRDISSNNILLDSKLEAFVSDFGTARLLDPDSANQTFIVGTYGYIAPGKQLDNNLH